MISAIENLRWVRVVRSRTYEMIAELRIHLKLGWWSLSVRWLFFFSTKREENTRIEGARGSHTWWHWSYSMTLVILDDIETPRSARSLDDRQRCQMQMLCHRLCHARGIVHLHGSWLRWKNQEDETDRREVINDDGVYMIYTLWMFYLSKYSQ